MSRPIREAMCVIGGLSYPVLPSMPWTRPQAAGCAGSRGSDLTGRPSRERSPCGTRSGGGEGHRWTLVPVLPSMPWARPQAAGCAGSHGSDLTGRPSRERSPCGARSGGGEGHRCTLVPVLPSMPSLAFSSRVIRATRPGADSAKDRAACTLGSMEPGAN